LTQTDFAGRRRGDRAGTLGTSPAAATVESIQEHQRVAGAGVSDMPSRTLARRGRGDLPLLTTAMILATAAMRLVPHPSNFTPVLAIALFGGARFNRRAAAFAVPVLAMCLSDLGLELLHGTGFHALMPVVYAAVVAGVVIGFPLRDRAHVGALIAGAVGSSLFFYLSTNFAVWLAWDMYPKSALGLLHCYAAALPFFRNTLASTLLYGAVLFQGHEWIVRGLVPSTHGA
jgi:hypothetical protein